MTKPALKLYWVETDDHDEDWFIIAEDEEGAASIHEGTEGYGEGDAEATLVCELPAELDAEPGWPSLELLEACSARIIRRETPRVVELGGRHYCEGMLEHELNRLNERSHRGGRRRPTE